MSAKISYSQFLDPTENSETPYKMHVKTIHGEGKGKAFIHKLLSVIRQSLAQWDIKAFGLRVV